MKKSVVPHSSSQNIFLILSIVSVILAAMFFSKMYTEKFTIGLLVSGGVFSTIIYAWYEIRKRLAAGNKSPTGPDPVFYLLLCFAFLFLILQYSVQPTMIASGLVMCSLIAALCISVFSNLSITLQENAETADGVDAELTDQAMPSQSPSV